MIKSEPMSVALISPDNNLGRYLDQIKKFPMLTAEDEYNLAKDWLDENNTKAAHKLVTSHLRLVAKIAMGYRGYGLPVADLIAEGNIGMMHAVKKFDPERGFRLATYAMWWIKAAIQEFVLRSWSQVKIGTTASQKKLFFNLRKIKSKINALDDGDLSPNQVNHIAKSLDVSEDDVISMNRRMLGGDHSLNAQMNKNDGEETEWQDLLTDDRENQETLFEKHEEKTIRSKLMIDALNLLKSREKDIIIKRRLTDNPMTLEDLSQEYKVSRERIRQIENRAFEKLQEAMKLKASEIKLI
ncbi:MAG: RNA polymerase sigma factor RpoH [Alphaproteobacteria bacterium]|nr:RNA polymerase sigma factor RpoH [Alphaproteobacteria bacterium]MDG2457694.1 RNA polymerase sigma factor RpoH [Alphaproteobacteria bacterium]